MNVNYCEQPASYSISSEQRALAGETRDLKNLDLRAKIAFQLIANFQRSYRANSESGETDDANEFK